MSENPTENVTFQDVQGRLEQLCGEVDSLEQPTRDLVYELLDAVDVLHRTALSHLTAAMGEDDLRAVLGKAHPAVAWLFDAYDFAPEGSVPEGDPLQADADERGDGNAGDTGREAAGQDESSAQSVAGAEPPPGATVLTVQEA